VIVQAWDFEPGDNFVVRMRDALERADRTLALVSGAYLVSPYCTDEWTGAFLHDPDGRNRLLQVRIEDCELPRLLRAQIYIDLVDLPRQQAKARLLAEVKRGRRKAPTEPPFPPDQRAGPRFPGQGLEITNLPPRNPDFSGRGQLLKELHEMLMAGGAATVVQAATVHGLGGVGKTQLALEYAHRYASDYDLIWWVPAEQPVAIPGLLGGFARRLGVPQQADQAELLAGLWDELRQRDRWLLIYDNAEGHRELEPYRPPGGSGRVLITSRKSTWGRETAMVRLDVLHRDEAVAFLRRRTGSTKAETLGTLAEMLGDLPLALEQAAAYMDETRTTPANYLRIFQEHGATLLALGEPLTTEQTVTTTWQVALDRLAATPGAPELLCLCAFLGPDAIPRGMFGEHAEVLPEPFRRTMGQPLANNEAVGALGRYSLVTVTEDSLTVHRLVQTVVRASLTLAEKQRWAGAALRLVTAAFPRGTTQATAWPICALLLPHVLTVVDHAHALEVEAEPTARLRLNAGFHLWRRGQYQQALKLEEQALAGRRRVLGDDHVDTLTSMNNLALTRWALGDLNGAVELHQRALAGFRRVLGDDDPATLYSMNNLALTHQALGDLNGAVEFHEQALAGFRRVLGDDHPATLTSIGNPAETRWALGDLNGAVELYEQALAGFRRVLGDDHPDTLTSMNNLAESRRGLGDLNGAVELHQQALAGRRRVLGDDHPATLTSITGLTRSGGGELGRPSGVLVVAAPGG
jgi:tetratricopeptide (TPR) repeat protein